MKHDLFCLCSSVQVLGWLRRLLGCSWDYFLPAYNCPLKEKIGIDPILGDNGKWLCGVRTLLQKPGCVVYSFG